MFGASWYGLVHPGLVWCILVCRLADAHNFNSMGGSAKSLNLGNQKTSAFNFSFMQELVDMTNEVEKKGEIYFKVAFPICYAILLSSPPGLLHAGVEKVQGGGRGGVHQGYVQSRWPTKKKRKIC